MKKILAFFSFVVNLFKSLILHVIRSKQHEEKETDNGQENEKS